LSELVLTRRYDVETVSEAAGWLAKLAELAVSRKSNAHAHHHSHDHRDGHQHAKGETHGIASFVYNVAKPFHPARLAEELSEVWPGLLRSKGFFWLATRHTERGLWQTAGQAWSGEYSGPWDAALPSEEIEEEGVDTSVWHPQWGDRMQELVFIGIRMDKACMLGRT
jgi:G3E family GTPase